MTSNLRSARANTLERCGSGMPSKSRNGWKVIVSSPRPSIMRRASAGVPLKDSRSFSKISTPLNCAAAMASIFSLRVPLRQTVAIALRMLLVHFLSSYWEQCSSSLLILSSADGASGERMFDAAGDVAAQHFAGALRVPLQSTLHQNSLLLCRDLTAVAQGDHLVAEILVEDGSMVVDQHLRSTGRDQCLMELPVVPLPFLGMCPVALGHPLLHPGEPVVRGNNPPLPFHVTGPERLLQSPALEK